MPYQCRQVHTNTPQVAVGIVEPRAPRLTARTLSYRTGFLLSATNTQYEEVGRKIQNSMRRFSPDSPGVALTSESTSTTDTHRNRRSCRERVTTQNNPKVAVERTGGKVIQVDIKSKATTEYLRRFIYISTWCAQTMFVCAWLNQQ